MKTHLGGCSLDTVFRRGKSSPVVVPLLSLALVAMAPFVQATPYYWNTANGTWQTNANWSTSATSGGTTGVAPTSADTAVFNQSAVNGAETVQFSGDTSIAGMTFSNTGTTLLDSDSTTARLLTLGTGGIAINAGAGAVTLGNATNTLNLALNGAQTWANNSGTTFTVVNGVTNTSSSTPLTLTIGGSGNTVVSGVIANNGSGTVALTKSGAGTLTLSGANTFTGAATVNAGTLALSSVGSTLAGSAVTVNSTGILFVTNGSATGSAVTRSNGLTLNGGKLKVTGSSAQNTTDTFGVLTLGQGAGVWEGGVASASVLSGGNNVILVSPNAAKNTRLNFTSASVNAGGTVLFSNAGAALIGANTLASTTAGGINIAFTGTAPTLIGDAVSGGTITTTSGIIPWAVTNTAGGTSLSDFVTYDAAYGVRTLNTYGSTLALSGGVAQNVKLTGADSTNNTNATVNSLILANSASSMTQNISGTLTVNSGALLLSPGFTTSALATTIAGGTLQLGTGGADGFIYMQQGRLNTISSVISGPDSSHNLTLDFGNANNSGGVLVLSGNNSYVGGTIVNSSNTLSSLVIGGTSTLALSLTAGTSGSLGSGDVTLNNISVYLNRSNAVTLANNISGTGASVIQQAATGTATLSGNISGTVGVTQSTASSTLVLSGTNTNSGATTLSAGSLQLNGAGSLSTGSVLTLTNGTTLKLRSDSTASFTPASITTSGVGTYNFDLGNLTSGTGQTLTLAGAMDFANGSQALNITSGSTGYTLGLGAITHSTSANGNSFTINASTAALSLASFKFGSFGSNLTLQSGNISVGGLLFNSNGSETITVAGANATFTGSNTPTGSRSTGNYAVILNSGTLNMNYAGFMTNPSGNTPSLTIAGGTLDNTSGGSITQLTNSTVALNGDFTFGGTNALNLGAGGVTLSANRQITTNGTGALTLGGSVSGSGLTITKAGSGKLTLNGAIGTGSGGVTVTGGTLTLAGNNTYTGLTDVQGGTLTLGRATSTIADTAAVQVSGGTLDVANSDTVGAVTLSSGTISGAGTLTGSSYSLTNSGTISAALGGAGVALTKTGAGTVTLSAANTYTGLTTVSAGRLDLNKTGGQAIAGNLTVSGGTAKLLQASQINSAKNLVVSGGTFDIQTFNQSLANVQLTSGTISGTSGVLTSANTYDMQAGTVGAILGGSGVGLTKTTSGTVTLSGANTYTGATKVDAGTLVLGVANAVSSSSSVVLDGGTLESAFSQTLGTLNLTLSSTLDLSSGGTFAFADSSSLAGSWTGTLSIVGTFVNNSSVRFGTSSGGVTGVQLSQITINGIAANIDSSGYLTLASIPEPSTYAAIVGALALAGAAWRRRR